MGRPANGHGSYSYGRRHDCDCEACELAVSRYQKRYNLDRGRGIKRRLPAEPLRAKVQQLYDEGVRPHQIHATLGISSGVLRHIMVGTRGRPPASLVERPTYEKFMALRLEDCLAVPTLVDSIGVVRRIHALQFLGYGPNDIAEGVGVSVSMIYQYLRAQQCLSTTVSAVHDAYVQMRNGHGQSAHSYWKARREGWPPPGAWDDETIDLYLAEPHETRCVVEDCHRAVEKASLCAYHHRAAVVGGAFRGPDARHYREVVLSMRSTVDPDGKRSSVVELAELGLDKQGVIERTGLRRDYVERVWRESVA